MKKFLFSILFIVSVLFSKGQQIGMYSHYFFKPMVYNPAFTGNDGDLNAMIINRSQWTDFNGSPQLNLVTLDGSLTNNKVGFGLSFISDRKGITNRIGGNINYSYRLNINDDAYIRFGISAGIIDQSINYSKALVENSNDPILFTNVQRKTSFDANAGMALIWKEFEFGFAIPQLAGNRINYVDNTNVRAYYTQTRHYMGTLKYKIFMSKEKGISIAPQVLTRFVQNAPFQYDGTIMVDWKEKFWIGGTYKSNYAVGINAGICLHKQLYIGYAYDFIIGGIGKYSGLSQEIMVNFKFGKNKKNETETNDIISKIAGKNDTLEKRLDSLQTELSDNQNKRIEDQRKIKENEDKINELNNKLDQQVKAVQEIKANQSNSQTQVKNNDNQNSGELKNNTDKVMDSGVWVVVNKIKDFKDENNQVPQKGFYVIAGTFFYRDFAMTEIKRLKTIGYNSTSFIFFEPKQFNYVFVAKEDTKEEAIKRVNEVKAIGINDVWIQILVE